MYLQINGNQCRIVTFGIPNAYFTCKFTKANLIIQEAGSGGGNIIFRRSGKNLISDDLFISGTYAPATKSDILSRKKSQKSTKPEPQKKEDSRLSDPTCENTGCPDLKEALAQNDVLKYNGNTQNGIPYGFGSLSLWHKNELMVITGEFHGWQVKNPTVYLKKSKESFYEAYAIDLQMKITIMGDLPDNETACSVRKISRLMRYDGGIDVINCINQDLISIQLANGQIITGRPEKTADDGLMITTVNSEQFLCNMGRSTDKELKCTK